jgi:hypothetical protein
MSENRYRSQSGRGVNAKLAPKMNEHIGWDNLVKKLEKEGKSKESAEKIAGYIKKEKYGK